jgi:multiple sugar transport system ATP-binding protein
MVFQSYALYPHMSVYENMAFGLEGIKIRDFVRDESGNQVLDKAGKPVMKKRSLTKQEIDERIQDAAEKLQITEYLKRKPTQLSGGQCQRVALGRAVVRHAKIFLLDEPLSNLDAKLRVQMRSELVRLHAELGNTMIYVTHDQTEAMTMASRIMVMNKGKVQQIGTPHEVYDSPANIFVATFMGSPTMNILPAHYDQGKILFPDGKQEDLSKEQMEATKAYFAERKRFLNEDIARLNHLSTEEKKAVLYSVDDLLVEERNELVEAEGFLATGTTELYFGIRPEDMSFSKTKTTALPIKVDVAELLGAEYSIHFPLSGKEVVARVSADDTIKNGDNGYLSFVKEEVHLFDKVTQKRIF